MAVDADSPFIAVVTSDGRVERGRIPHWSTCTSAEAFRRRASTSEIPTDAEALTLSLFDDESLDGEE